MDKDAQDKNQGTDPGTDQNTAQSADMFPKGSHVYVEHDGFVGTVIGDYKRLDGYEGRVVQQDRTRVVHVYGLKWLKTVQ